MQFRCMAVALRCVSPPMAACRFVTRRNIMGGACSTMPNLQRARRRIARVLKSASRSWRRCLSSLPGRGLRASLAMAPTFSGSNANNVFFAGGYNGSGVSRGTAFGTAIADYASGESSQTVSDCLASASRVPGFLRGRCSISALSSKSVRVSGGLVSTAEH